MELKENTQALRSNKVEAWFEDFLSTLHSHLLQLQTNVASREMKEFYEKMASSTTEELYLSSKKLGQEYFVKKIILDYVGHLKMTMISKLAFDYNDSEVLVWAEVNASSDEESDELESKLILAEAKVNAKYYEYGFAMNSTIVEKSDKLSVPNHYLTY